MLDESLKRCPVCGGGEWRIELNGPNFRIDVCANGCIGRTVPPPIYSPDLFPGDSTSDSLQQEPSQPEDFAYAEKIVDSISRFRQSGRLLDIGSGCGHLLKSAKDRGYTATGLDASPEAVEKARQAFGVESAVGFFPQKTYPPAAFDVVVMNHVMEHVDDPKTVIAEIERILKPGGVLAVCIPDFSGLMRRVKGARWQGLMPSQHVWQIPSSAVVQLAQSAGLEPLGVKRSNLEYRRGSGSFLKWLALQIVLLLAKLLRMGDNAIVLARKVER